MVDKYIIFICVSELKHENNIDLIQCYDDQKIDI